MPPTQRAKIKTQYGEEDRACCSDCQSKIELLSARVIYLEKALGCIYELLKENNVISNNELPSLTELISSKTKANEGEFSGSDTSKLSSNDDITERKVTRSQKQKDQLNVGASSSLDLQLWQNVESQSSKTDTSSEKLGISINDVKSVRNGLKNDIQENGLISTQANTSIVDSERQRVVEPSENDMSERTSRSVKRKFKAYKSSARDNVRENSKKPRWDVSIVRSCTVNLLRISVDEATGKIISKLGINDSKRVGESTPNRVRESTSNRKTDNTLDAVTENTSNRVTESTSNRVTGNTLNKVTESNSNGVAQSTSNRVRESTSNRKTDNTLDAVTGNTSNRVTESTSNRVTGNTLTKVTESNSNGVAQSTSNGVTQSNSKGVTQSISNGVTRSNSNRVAKRSRKQELKPKSDPSSSENQISEDEDGWTTWSQLEADMSSSSNSPLNGDEDQTLENEASSVPVLDPERGVFIGAEEGSNYDLHNKAEAVIVERQNCTTSIVNSKSQNCTIVLRVDSERQTCSTESLSVTKSSEKHSDVSEKGEVRKPILFCKPLSQLLAKPPTSINSNLGKNDDIQVIASIPKQVNSRVTNVRKGVAGTLFCKPIDQLMPRAPPSIWDESSEDEWPFDDTPYVPDTSSEDDIPPVATLDETLGIFIGSVGSSTYNFNKNSQEGASTQADTNINQGSENSIDFIGSPASVCSIEIIDSPPTVNRPVAVNNPVSVNNPLSIKSVASINSLASINSTPSVTPKKKVTSTREVIYLEDSQDLQSSIEKMFSVLATVETRPDVSSKQKKVCPTKPASDGFPVIVGRPVHIPLQDFLTLPEVVHEPAEVESTKSAESTAPTSVKLPAPVFVAVAGGVEPITPIEIHPISKEREPLQAYNDSLDVNQEVNSSILEPEIVVVKEEVENKEDSEGEEKEEEDDDDDNNDDSNDSNDTDDDWEGEGDEDEDEEEEDDDWLESRKKKNKKTNKYLCKSCPKSYKTKSSFEKHLAEVHRSKEFYPHCKLCGIFFQNLQVFDRHVCTKDKSASQLNNSLQTHSYANACKLCGAVFTSMRALKEHMCNEHPTGKPFSSGDCGLAFDSAKETEEHSAVHSGEERYDCVHCGLPFNSKLGIIRHLAVHSLPGEFFTCKYCSDTFQGHKKFLEHTQLARCWLQKK